MSLEAGVYTLWNGDNNRSVALELFDGEWSWGTVGGRNRSDSWCQRWMVCPHPQDPGLFNIFNLKCGALLGVFDGRSFWPPKWLIRSHGADEQRDSFHTKAGPVSGNQDCAQWRVDDEAKGGNWKRWFWHRDVDGADSRALDVPYGNDGQRGEACRINGAPSQTWDMERDNLDSYDNWRCFWMRNVPDDQRLTRLNLPGTHQTLALFPMNRWRYAADGSNRKFQRTWISIPGGGTENPCCQTKALYEQMCDGVRFFDLRLDVATFNGELTAYGRHGLAEQGYSWWAMLQSMVAFVRRFQNQTVFASVQYEKNDANPEDRRADFVSAVDKVSACFGDSIFFTQDRAAQDISLGEIRGKIVLLGNGGLHSPESKISSRDSFYAGDSGRIAEDHYDLPKSQFQQKADLFRQNIENAKNDDNHWYASDANMSGMPAVVTQIQGFARKIGNVSRINVLRSQNPDQDHTYDPVDFFDWFRPILENDILTEDRLGKDGAHRIGVVDFDFYDRTQICVDRLIRSNPGCGNLGE